MVPEDELLDGIAPELPPIRPRRDHSAFKPWHKPRKQAIRWDHLHSIAIRTFLSKPEDRKTEIKYLGLPGAELLDIRSLLSIESNKLEDVSPDIFYIGFDTAPGDESIDDVTAVDLTSNPRVSVRSQIISDDIRTLGVENSMARLQVNNYAPFDVVNLDFCNSVLKDEVNDASTIYSALQSLFEAQRSAPKGWGLAITTRIDRGSVSNSAIDQMQSILQHSSTDDVGFDTAFYSMFGTSTNHAFTDDGDVFSRSLLVALLVWLSQLAAFERFTVRFERPIVYSVKESGSLNGCEDMASLSFYFERDTRPAVVFPKMATRVDDSPKLPTIKARRAVVDVAKRTNIDRELNADQKWLDACMRHTKLLLEEAGIDVSEYDRWALEKVRGTSI